ncbi:MAG: hypothetical protein ABSD59_18275 [Terracidiphilus sp.]|jgi:predicted lipid-binding transport protein (Tim44 family)
MLGLTSNETASSSGSEVPQFATAEYAHVPGTERCRICGNLIAGEYYRVNSQMACAKCATEARDGQPKDSHAAFLRALLLGAGGALLGLIVYSSFTIITGWTIGYIALAVGWLVATAMMKGSNGMGGTRYQIAAVLLTYAAISLSAIPIAISYMIKNAPSHHAQTTQSTQSNDTSAAGNPENAQPNSQQARPSFGAVLGQMVLWGLASPFLELQSPGSGILGLVILFVGLSIAYRMTKARRLSVDGPFNVTG